MVGKTTIRVRYEETDRMGVAYYAKYFVWFEVARTEFFRAMGLSYRKMEEEKKIRFMVVGAQCAYKSPVTYDDSVTVETVIKDIRNTSLTFSYTLKKLHKLVALGETTHVFTNADKKPIKIPEELRKALR